MSIAVRKSSPEVIRPLEPQKTTMTRGTIKLTSFDRVFVNFPATALLVFEHGGYEAIESIKRALSKALVLYYPFAGRITSSSGGADDGDEEFNICCTDEGVKFVTASVDCGLQEAMIFGESTAATALLDQLAILYPAGSYGSSSDDPLLSVQVTEFSCGGLVLGVTWNHAIADGTGLAQFLAAVGELARGSPSPSVVPTRSDEAVSNFSDPLSDPVRHSILMCPDTTGMELIVPLDITVPSALINRVKAESRGCFDGQPCTTFEVVLAVIWRCRVRAAMSNDPTGSRVCLTSTFNVRKRAGAKGGYYGNCITVKLLAAAASDAVAEASIMDLVRMIKYAKVKMGNNDEQLMQGLGGRYNLIHVASWRNLGFEHVDFGSGAPARVMFHELQVAAPVPTCIMYPPCKGKDGVNLLLHAVKVDQVQAFLGELAKLEHIVI